MLNKKITLITAIIIIGASFLIAGFLNSQKESIQRVENNSKNNNAVTTTVKNKPIENILSVGGTAEAFNKIQLYAEVSGILETTSTEFRVGNHFRKGDILIKMDDAVFRNNLMAQKSTLLNNLTLLLPDLSLDFPKETTKWENYLKELDLEKNIKPLPDTKSDKERYYVAARNIYNQYYSIKSQEQTLAKYTIKAPYDGVVTQSDIKPGVLVRAGQKLGEFTDVNIYEIAVSVSSDDLAQIKIGEKVALTSTDLLDNCTGLIERINPNIDRTSQTTTVYIISKNKSIKDGMYITAHIKKSTDNYAVEVNKELLINNNSVFVVKDSVLVLQRINVELIKNNKAFVSGIKDGQKILAKTYTNAAEGKKLSELELN